MNKVPQVTIAFWLAKICATTLGETGGDLLSMSLDLGYGLSTAVFVVLFLVTLGVQLSTPRYHAGAYWAVILTTTTAGTTLSDYLDRTAGLGYLWGSLLLAAILAAILAVWRITTGSISVSHIASRKIEAFYWLSILVSNTLGTALGDYASTSSGLGFEGGAVLFGSLLALVSVAYLWTNASHTILFWLAFVLTRPLGATLGDLLTKAHDEGGLAMGRGTSSLILAVFVIACIVFTRTGARTEPPT